MPGLFVLGALSKLAHIRNHFAHELRPNFSSKEENDFLNVIRQSERLKIWLSETGSASTGLQNGFRVLYLYLFEQLLKLTDAQTSLHESWKKMVEVDDKLLSSKRVYLKPAVLMELGKDED